MKKSIVIAMAAVLVLGLVIGGCFLSKILPAAWAEGSLSSPEQTLTLLFRDLNTKGLSGVEQYLTDGANWLIDKIGNLSEKTGVSQYLMKLKGGFVAEVLKAFAMEIDWTVEDVRTDGNSAKAVVGFDFLGFAAGRMELSMKLEHGGWKVDGLGMPRVTRLKLW